MDTEPLKHWFLSGNRDLPWRRSQTNTPSPYAVWVSEVMLQQTQVSVVIPYFERWMRRFPTIFALAEADRDAVIKEWEGLGYYSRARNLHEGAAYVVKNHGGNLPDTWDELNKIKGLGPYTIGAILSFAFQKKAACVDGNVLRVLARFYCLTDDIAKGSTITKIWGLAEDLLPEDCSWIVNEALIELGATVCGRQPKCTECPLKKSCKAFLMGMENELPVKLSKSAITELYRAVAVISTNDCLLVKKGAKGKIMSDLHEFPYFEIDPDQKSQEILSRRLHSDWNLDLNWQKSLPEVKHSFTRYRARLFPEQFTTPHQKTISGYEWIPIKRLKELPFSSGHRRILEYCSKELALPQA